MSIMKKDSMDRERDKQELLIMALWYRIEDDNYKVAKTRFNLFSRDSDSLYVDVTDDGNHVSRYLTRANLQPAVSKKFSEEDILTIFKTAAHANAATNSIYALSPEEATKIVVNAGLIREE